MKNGRAKISRGDAAEIRRLYKAGGVTQQRLGYMFRLNQATVSGIIRRANWK